MTKTTIMFIYNVLPIWKFRRLNLTLYCLLGLDEKAVESYGDASGNMMEKKMPATFFRALSKSGERKILSKCLEGQAKFENKESLLAIIESYVFLRDVQNAEKILRKYQAEFSNKEHSYLMTKLYLAKNDYRAAFDTVCSYLLNLKRISVSELQRCEVIVNRIGLSFSGERKKIAVILDSSSNLRKEKIIKLFPNVVFTTWDSRITENNVIQTVVLPGVLVSESEMFFSLARVQFCSPVESVIYFKDVLILPSSEFSRINGDVTNKNFVSSLPHLKNFDLNNTPPKSLSNQKVLIALGGGMGNAIQLTPFINYLHLVYNCEIDIFLESSIGYMASVFEKCEKIKNVWTSSLDMNDKMYDVSIFTALSSCVYWFPSRYHLNLELYFPFFSTTRTINEAEYPFWCLKELGLIGNYTKQDYSSKFITNAKWSLDKCMKNRIVFHAGSKKGVWDKKKWPHFENLALKFAKKGFEVISVGGADEYVSGTRNLTNLPLIDTVEVLKSSRVLISNDSGVMHVGDALGLPLVALFGPSSTTKNKPLRRYSEVISLEMECSPCQFSKLLIACPSNKCMKEISPDHVAEKVLSLIEKSHVVM